MAVDAVAQILARICEQENIAIRVHHHNRKGETIAGNIEAARGAVSLIDAARIGKTLTRMTPDEAKLFEIDEKDRRSFIRLDDGKVNLIEPTAALWFRLVGVLIGNGNETYPDGDNVQTVERWQPPETWVGLCGELLNQMLDDIDAGLPNGERYSDANKAGDRAVWKVVQQHAPDKSPAQCQEVIKTWRKSKLLKVEKYMSTTRREEVSGLVVDATKRPT